MDPNSNKNEGIWLIADFKDPVIPLGNPQNDQGQSLRERYVIALIEATHPFQKEAVDREVTLELLIQAADSLKEHLEKELQEFREETD